MPNAASVITAEDVGRIYAELAQLRGRVRDLEMAPATSAPSPKVMEDSWELVAQRLHRNTVYYRGLVVAIGELLGPEAYIADDGSRAEDVFCAKVPGIVATRLRRLKYLEAREEVLDRLVRVLLDKEQRERD